MQPSELTVGQAVDQALRAQAAGEHDREWDLVSHLHRHGGAEAMAIASHLLSRPESSHRMLGADILSQLGAGPGRSAVDGPYRNDALTLLLAALPEERDPAVLRSITIGFLHLGDERCLAPLVRLHQHADPEVRAGVTFALLGRPEPAALETLMVLSTDPDPRVRDWATFGLARQTTQDFPQLRKALAARLADDDPDTLAEAIHGLATRGDGRALPKLLDALETPPQVSDPNVITEALYSLGAVTGDPRLRPYLLAERNEWLRDAPDEALPDEMQAALARYERLEEH